MRSPSSSTKQLTKPSSKATLAPKSRPVKHSSLTIDPDPTSFGNLCNVPTSAARPTLASLTLNTALALATLTSAQQIISIPAPMQHPCTAATTGT
mmetsp:Transcript_30477/g.68262  ORF Transcript_30477/g.68262 Transcript_30477/m.68262 type:complete len:95 (+) Transcript_30477:261-545(+)